MLRWHHLKAELDNRKKQWPIDSEYEFDHEKQTVTWFFGRQGQAPYRFVCHLAREELWSPRPFEVAERVIGWARREATAEG